MKCNGLTLLNLLGLLSFLILYSIFQMESGNPGSVISKIKLAEDVIKSSFQRVEEIEKKLLLKYVSVEIREKWEKELKEMKKALHENEVELRSLRKENSKSFAIAATLLFFIFLLYGLYLFMTGSPL